MSEQEKLELAEKYLEKIKEVAIAGINDYFSALPANKAIAALCDEYQETTKSK